MVLKDKIQEMGKISITSDFGVNFVLGVGRKIKLLKVQLKVLLYLEQMKTKKISIHHIYLIIAGLLAGLIVLGGNYFAEKGFSLYEISIFVGAIFILIANYVIIRREGQAS